MRHLKEKEHVDALVTRGTFMETEKAHKKEFLYEGKKIGDCIRRP